MSGLLILAGFAFSLSNNPLLANDDRNNEDRGDGEHAREVHNNGSTLEVHISDNGKVLVRGAKVTAITGNTVSAFTLWGTVNLNWGVNVLSDTQINRKFGGNGSISEISVGDFISFQGTLVTTSATPIMVNARVIKDWSLQKKNTRTTIEGTIKSMGSVTLPTSLVVTSDDKDYTVNIATDTSILNKLWLRVSLGSFAVGNKVRVYGVVNTNATIDATIVRNTSL